MSELFEKIEEGFKRAHRKMIEEKALKNQELVFSDGNGKPYFVKARDLLTEEELMKVLNIMLL